MHRAAGVWRVSELRGLDGAGLRGAVELGGALERLVGKGKAGASWGELGWGTGGGKGGVGKGWQSRCDGQNSACWSGAQVQ